MTEADMYFWYKGIYLSSYLHVAEGLKIYEEFTFRKDDIIIVTYPKSGTSWLKEIVPLILSGGDPASVKSSLSWDRVPWLEVNQYHSDFSQRPSPRIYCTHFLYNMMLPSFFEAKPKVIYLMRNPKDVFTSFLHYSDAAIHMVKPGPQSEFLQKFLEGKVCHGSWFDHIKGWLNAEDKDRIMYISYEEMIMDLKDSVARIAQYLEKPLTPEVIEKITDRCLFKNMKQNNMSNYSVVPAEIWDRTKSDFLRKGVTGDWTNQLTGAEAEYFDAVYKFKMKDVNNKSECSACGSDLFAEAAAHDSWFFSLNDSMTEADLYTLYKGVYLPSGLHTPHSLQYYDDFTLRHDDIIIVTYPKSGTTWMQEIVPLIMSGGDPASVESLHNWDRVPWLEMYRSSDLNLEKRPSPRMFTTHFHYNMMPPGFFEVKPKVIYVMRNPKDVFTSFLHYSEVASFLVNPGPQREFLHKFLDGKVCYGSWFDHIKGWLNAEDKDRIMYISYEEMIMDLKDSVARIAQYLEKPLGTEVIEKITDRCLFKNMKQNNMSNYSAVPCEILDRTKSEFLRKGITGDWKNQLTVAEAEYFDAVYKDKINDIKYKFVWDQNRFDEHTQ
ncbi:uncharacterized protein LOC117753415 [Hippoglossus hippoglossus]|uniref:uncharacterized protein LOC117753415 n=1 Tax=Hippoglossus hippoglossus TaxID=8267 RepID=UPI00148B40EA|nr:uncharacterized protein LOC117753415 [Hippoglossus hippoglossus]